MFKFSIKSQYSVLFIYHLRHLSTFKGLLKRQGLDLLPSILLTFNLATFGPPTSDFYLPPKTLKGFKFYSRSLTLNWFQGLSFLLSLSTLVFKL